MLGFKAECGSLLAALSRELGRQMLLLLLKTFVSSLNLMVMKHREVAAVICSNWLRLCERLLSRLEDFNEA